MIIFLVQLKKCVFKSGNLKAKSTKKATLESPKRRKTCAIVSPSDKIMPTNRALQIINAAFKILLAATV